MGAAVAARDGARRDRGGNGLLTRPKTGDKILERRAKGETVERIAQALRLVVVDVAEFIKIRRRGGDKRALTDCQARVTARLGASKTPPPAPIPVPADPAPVRRRPILVALPINPRALGDYVARMHRCADRVSSVHPNAAAGLRHLADLHELCPTFYPTYSIGPEGATLAQTRLRFPEQREGKTAAGPGLSCMEA